MRKQTRHRRQHGSPVIQARVPRDLMQAIDSLVKRLKTNHSAFTVEALTSRVAALTTDKPNGG